MKRLIALLLAGMMLLGLLPALAEEEIMEEPEAAETAEPTPTEIP